MNFTCILHVELFGKTHHVERLQHFKSRANRGKLITFYRLPRNLQGVKFPLNWLWGWCKDANKCNPNDRWGGGGRSPPPPLRSLFMQLFGILAQALPSFRGGRCMVDLEIWLVTLHYQMTLSACYIGMQCHVDSRVCVCVCLVVPL